MDVKVVKNLQYVFSKNNKPELKVKPGEEVFFTTEDCFGGQLETENDAVTEVDLAKANPATGPLYIEGAEVGDILKVDILDIQISNYGFSVTLPEVGPLWNVSEVRTKKLEIIDDKINFNGVEFPINPMIGVIGVAPAGDDIPTAMWGTHGGNMDNKKITKNTSIYFPVNTPGALLQIGDLHAVQGDGELAGSGLEIKGTVKVKVDLIKDKSIKGPVHEDKDFWYTISNSRDYTEAVKIATHNMKDLLKDAYGWDETDIALYFSLQGDIEVCQSAVPADGDLVLRMAVPKIESKPLL